MKHLVSIQDWGEHLTERHFWLDGDKIIATVNVNIFSDIRTFDSLWVIPEYRGLGISHIVLKEIMSTPMACMVRKDNWVASLYMKYNFSYWYDEDEEYYWMKNFIDNETDKIESEEI